MAGIKKWVKVTFKIVRVIFGPKIDTFEFFFINISLDFSVIGPDGRHYILFKSYSFRFLRKILIISKMGKWVILGPKSTLFNFFDHF